MPVMRAKMQVQSVTKHGDPATAVSLSLSAVTSKPFDAEGKNEDNTFATYTPSATLSMSITNPALLDKFTNGQKFYIDFTEAAE